MKKDTSAFIRLLVVVLAGLTLLLVGGLQVSAQEKPVVRFYLFYGETCPHCHEVMDNFLPGVYEKYGDQLEYEYIEVWNDTDNYITLLGLEQKLGVPEDRQGAVPALVIGDQVLIGAVEIPEQLEILIDAYLAQGEIELAEAFMEESRQYLFANGYYIRKLNQAYFAFHGAYADEPTSISPIGVKLNKLRDQIDSLKDYLNTVADMTSQQELQELIDSLE